MLNYLIYVAANPYSVKANEIGVPTSTQTVGQILANGTRLLVTLVGMISVIAIIYGAIQLQYSRGNAKGVERGRETILYACVALGLSISAYAIVTFITSQVK